MILPDYKYENIANLLNDNIPYRTIANIESVSPTTVCKCASRYSKTGNPQIPYSEHNSKYGAIINSISEKIDYYLALSLPNIKKRFKSRITVKELYNKLIEDGFSISFSKVKELLRLERNVYKKSFLDIYYTPGVMCQFNWGQKLIKFNGLESPVRVYFAVFALPYSNFRYVHVTETMNGKAFIEAFNAFIHKVNGIFPILLIDNMKIAAINKNHKNEKCHLTNLFQDLSKFYGFETRLCTPYRPNQKGVVENAVDTLKQHMFSFNPSFDSLQDLQNKITITINILNNKKHNVKNDTSYKLMLHEKALLKPLPNKTFIYQQEIIHTVRRSTLVSFDGNYYSAPEKFKGEKVIVRYTDKKIRIVSMNGTVLVKYNRCYNKNKRFYRVWNMLTKLKIKSKGFSSSNEKRSMPKILKLLHDNIFKNNTEDFLAFLELAKGLKNNFIKKMFSYHKRNNLFMTIDSSINFLERYQN